MVLVWLSLIGGIVFTGYEVIQAIKEYEKYFKDYWNIIDFGTWFKDNLLIYDPLARDICDSDGNVLHETPDVGEIRSRLNNLKFIDGAKLQVPLQDN